MSGLPSQLAKSDAQLGVHTPATHAVVPFVFEHAAPHVPQFTVVESAVSHPFPTALSQSPYPTLHATVHTPTLHAGAAWFELHAVPHAPQLVRLALVSVSHPLFLLPSQSLNTPVHTGVHPPPTQLVVPFVFEHAIPHPPQLPPDVCTFVSHPFAGFPSQSANPAKHVGTHVPAWHAVVPFPFAHVFPHEPQLPVPVFRFASHPFAGFPSQLAYPELHVGTHAPAEHVVVPFPFVHGCPHAPQLPRLVCTFVSHPFATLPSQLPNPGSHAIEHAPPVQLAVPFALEHAVPHAPQFAVLAAVFTSHPFADTPSQFANPAPHVPSVHVPPEHDSAAFDRSQSDPHAPQFVSVVSGVSHPLPGLPSQSPNPPLQLDTPHLPATQFGVPPAAGHTFPHCPQLLMLDAMLVSHPFTGLPSQSSYPALHVGAHAPAAHATPPFPFVHTSPHAPQFVVVPSDVSHPSFGSPLQSPKPAPHAGTHTPATQLVVPFAFAHAMPHPPHAVPVVCVFVSHPSVGSPSQLAKPLVQLGAHTPDAHAVVPCAFAHTSPHAPQFALVSSATSHPFAALPSQSPKFALHVIAHVPAVHVAVPLLLLHPFPHVPQFCTLVCVFTSHPFTGLPSQLPNPPAHVPSVHDRDEHDSVAFARSHTAPHVPQSVSVPRLASHPFAATPSQSPYPTLHDESAHTPLKHVGLAFG